MKYKILIDIRLFFLYIFFIDPKNDNINLVYKLRNIELYQILFEKKIEEEFGENNRVNLNELESKIPFGRKSKTLNNYSHEINVGLSLDKKFILKTMITTASVIYSQISSTYLRLHFAVVQDFKPKDMIKIYSLRDRIREDVEFNFYNASKVEKELNSISFKGPGLAAKLLLPQLVFDNVKRLIIIDSGDVLVLKDLSKMYNWNMSNNIYMGSPDPGAGMFGKISNRTMNVFINAGMYLIDIDKVKKKNMYNLFLKYKNVYNPPFAEQIMINDIANGKIGYLPVEFGLVPPFSDDESSANITIKSIYIYFNLSIISKNSNFLPKTYEEYMRLAYNPIIIHSWNGKWNDGNGMNIYRKLCQFFINLTGLKKEICEKIPGYCWKN